MWDSKAARHGAAGEGLVWVVVDMVRRKESRRWAGLEAIVLDGKPGYYDFDSKMKIEIV